MSTNPTTTQNLRANSTTLGALWIVYAILRFIAVILLVLYAGTATVMFGALLTRVVDYASLMAIFHIFYLAAIIVLVGVMPWNHAGVSESPFVSVLRLAKVPAAAYVMNFVVLTAALSGANAKLYVASRLLFSMGRTGWAPASLGKLNASGSPRLALLVSSYGIVTALIIEHWAAQKAFLYIMGAAFSGLILSWVISLAAHVSFRRRLTRQQVAALPMRSPLGMWGSVLGCTLATIAVLHTLFATRINAIGGLVFFAALTAAYVAIKRRRAT